MDKEGFWFYTSTVLDTGRKKADVEREWMRKQWFHGGTFRRTILLCAEARSPNECATGCGSRSHRHQCFFFIPILKRPFFLPIWRTSKISVKKNLAELPCVEISDPHGRGTAAVGLVVGTQLLFCFSFAQKSETLPRNKGWMLHFWLQIQAVVTTFGAPGSAGGGKREALEHHWGSLTEH